MVSLDILAALRVWTMGSLLVNWLSTWRPGDWLALGVGVALGAIVVFSLRSRQVWAQRRSFGYNVYTADRLRRRFAGWVVFAGLIGAAVMALFLLHLLPGSAPAPTPTATPAADASALVGMKLVIPRLGIETSLIDARIVGHDWDISQLTTEVAHLQGTAYPGQPGNAALAGHVTIPGAGWGPFKDLGTMELGDEIAVRTRDNQVFTYRVSQVTNVDPTDVQVALPTDDTRLTLMTCTSWDTAVNRYTQRVVVVATRVN